MVNQKSLTLPHHFRLIPLDYILIVDLDNTLFDTSSMDRSIFMPAIEQMRKHFTSQELADRAIRDIWTYPIDEVSRRHNIPDEIIEDFLRNLESENYTLDIKPFADYKTLNELDVEKILVTTGIESLQRAKISELGITDHFTDIYIDKVTDTHRIYKKGIFSKIVQESTYKSHQFWIIGDNGNAEIKAGRELGLKTIQRKKPDQTASEYADFTLHTFHELYPILASQ